MHSQNRWTGILAGVVLGVLFSGAIVWAGILEPIAGPTEAGSQMYTLDQIYHRLNNGLEVPKKTAFSEPWTGPGGTMHRLDVIYDLIGERAPVPRTGQTSTVPINPAPAGSDGALQRGVAWPSPRFTDNANGTVTDKLTGLIWLRKANCFGSRSWNQALSEANTLAAGYCGLTDGSTAGQWRLPNLREMQSLIHYGFFSPALPNTSGLGQWTEGNPFEGVISVNYWSGTTTGASTGHAWYVDLDYGSVYFDVTPNSHRVWPVRGGQ
ncbi:MAG: DUF1566 domain-containing protein [Desulfobacterota bacterium]|nr:DUF1566 domain-containing protein [Thermodesulfobacteriota bacterium]